MSRRSRLPIPENALLDCGAILGKRGAGKSSLARLLAEHELDAEHRIGIIDPMGDAAGIRLTPAGRPSRFQNVIIFGGQSADIPISEDDGPKLARIVGTSNISFIIDLSGMIQSEQLRFMTAFADVLYDEIKIPVTLFVDEAHIFAPQERGEASPKLLNRMTRLNSQGRKRGIFLWLMTQRPARINKNILGGTETLIAMKVIMPQDVNPVTEWFESHGPEAQAEVRRGLGALKVGEAFVYASGLEFFKRVQFPLHSTLDTGRTPKHGEALGGVKMPKVDVSALAEQFGQMATGDPRDDEIKALRDQLKSAQARLADEREAHRATVVEMASLNQRENGLLEILVAIQMRIGAAIGSQQIEALPLDEPYDRYTMVESDDGIVRAIPRAGDNPKLPVAAKRRVQRANRRTGS